MPPLVSVPELGYWDDAPGGPDYGPCRTADGYVGHQSIIGCQKDIFNSLPVVQNYRPGDRIQLSNGAQYVNPVGAYWSQTNAPPGTPIAASIPKSLPTPQINPVTGQWITPQQPIALPPIVLKPATPASEKKSAKAPSSKLIVITPVMALAAGALFVLWWKYGK